MRVHNLLAGDDIEGAAAWRRIVTAIKEMQRTDVTINCISSDLI